MTINTLKTPYISKVVPEKTAILKIPLEEAQSLLGIEDKDLEVPSKIIAQEIKLRQGLKQIVKTVKQEPSQAQLDHLNAGYIYNQDK